jgi:polar amino acid transport system permease protein
MNAFQILWEYREAFSRGFVVTLELVVLASSVGSVSGICLELVCGRFENGVRRVVDVFAFCFSAVPALVILFWLYYPAQSLLSVSVSPFWTAVTALILLNSFAVYRIAADAVKDFPQQYISSALVCGLTKRQIIRYVQAPLLIRATLPRWIDQQVVILQTSVFASLVSVDEIFREAQRINSVVYQPVLIYTSMALVFLITAGSALYLAKYLRDKFHRDFSEH